MLKGSYKENFQQNLNLGYKFDYTDDSDYHNCNPLHLCYRFTIQIHCSLHISIIWLSLMNLKLKHTLNQITQVTPTKQSPPSCNSLHLSDLQHLTSHTVCNTAHIKCSASAESSCTTEDTKSLILSLTLLKLNMIHFKSRVPLQGVDLLPK